MFLNVFGDFHLFLQLFTLEKIKYHIKKSLIIKNIGKYNIIVTPHVGGMTYQGQLRAYSFALSKFKYN